jgi:polyphosphate kinase
VAGRGLNFAVVLRAESGDERVALVGVPDSVDPLLSFDWRRSNDRAAATRTDRGFVWTEQVLQAHLTAAFPGMTVVSSHRFRLMRDADLSMPVDETLHPLRRVDALIRHRRTSPAVVLVVDRTLPAAPLKLLSDRLDVPAAHIRAVRSVSDLQRLWDVARIPRAELHDAELHQPVPAALSGQVDPFAVMRERSVLLHHPYESFQPVVDLIDKAGADPDVEQISMSLYRTDRESPVAHALLAALQRGKQVRVVVELNARFDEERNAAWARTLERAGAQVLYGVDGLKVHAKTAMIARREGAALRRYVHLSSGNYNAFTSRVYTDLGLLTADEAIASDVSSLFDFIGGGPTPTRFRRLLVAPFTLRRTLGDLIEREIGWARRGVDAHLILKMNALSDRETIRQLYRASEAGVKIDLIVRGICCLRPGLCGLSRNIAVRSVVGQFLEHSRAWYFRNGGKEEAFIGSADVMPRNLDRRIEIMTPLTDQALVRRIRDEVLGLYLADNVKARLLVGDGTYVRPTLRRDEPAIVSQTALLERAGMRFPGPSGVRSQHSAALVPAP